MKDTWYLGSATGSGQGLVSTRADPTVLIADSVITALTFPRQQRQQQVPITAPMLSSSSCSTSRLAMTNSAGQSLTAVRPCFCMR